MGPFVLQPENLNPRSFLNHRDPASSFYKMWWHSTPCKLSLRLVGWNKECSSPKLERTTQMQSYDYILFIGGITNFLIKHHEHFQSSGINLLVEQMHAKVLLWASPCGRSWRCKKWHRHYLYLCSPWWSHLLILRPSVGAYGTSF